MKANRIAAAKIHPNPLQPRRNFDVEAYRNWLWERLRENLAALGAEELMPEVKK